jgi:hypothetical protein
MRGAINRSENEMAIAGTPRRRGCGCLGCLGQSGAALLLGVVLMLAITDMLMPWAFHLGGTLSHYSLLARLGHSTRAERKLPALGTVRAVNPGWEQNSSCFESERHR